MSRKYDLPNPLQWSVFARNDGLAVVPRASLLIRLRQMTSDAFFAQEALQPLKRFLDANFITGPLCVLVSLYLPTVGGVLLGIGIASLAVSALYWFATHWLCARYLRYRGFAEADSVEAEDYEAALRRAGS